MVRQWIAVETERKTRRWTSFWTTTAVFSPDEVLRRDLAAVEDLISRLIKRTAMAQRMQSQMDVGNVTSAHLETLKKR